ncbi:lanthionine synthetase C family protein [Bacillus cereus group sp. BfR-BA-01331]|uniref:lanthionine synthetase C family protein n=1 Tax=Bacillus cereus group sp. BfR-BA-01331 TaxID=2920307 RepID=UPI001F571421|nr:lanthionine synthetase C family protein [Bacillus cereus group sp. BfR-BA-01331]
MNSKNAREYVCTLECEGLESKIENIILGITNIMKDPEYVKGIVTNRGNVMHLLNQEIIPWEEGSLSTGYPSICLLLGELSEHYSNDKWDQIAHNYVLKINEYLAEKGMTSTSIFQGLAGIGLAVTALSKGFTRYQNFIEQINEIIIKQINLMLPLYYERLEANNLKMSDYDVISGLTGVGRYLLFYKERERDSLEKILSFLIKMTQDKKINGHLAPGWYTSSENQFLDHEKKLYPNGNFNLGLSHGITGPLALLAQSLENGIEVTGHKEAITKIADWIIQFKIETEKGLFWSFRVDWEEFIAGKGKKENISRAAWCYGTPGVARTIYLAGKALGNQEYIDVSLKALDDIFKLERNEWGLYSPTFCHGFAGLLHILNLMYIDTKEPNFKEYIMELLEMILEKFDKDSNFGFYNYELDKDKINSSINIGLIEGVSGILLVLLGLLKPIRTNWDAAFLLI